MIEQEKEVPEEMTQAEFARHIEKGRSWVAQLRKEDRLVMVGEGRKARVNVAESIARIAATEDPNRDDVTKRHAKERGKEKSAKTKIPETDVEETSYQAARRRKETALARQAEIELAKMEGNLVDIERVKLGGMDIGAHVRQALENMADQMAPVLAPETDPEAIHAMLVDHVEQVLTDIADKIGKLAEVES